jgi:hypothetical protein
MATRSNPYAIDPFLQQAVGNLTRAFIGSAQDDASLASARASDARAGLYGSQDKGVQLSNQYAQDNMDAIASALGDSGVLNSMFGTLGLPSGNLPTNPTGRPGPFIGNSPETSTAPGMTEDGMRGLVRSMFFGGTPGNPQQSANAAQTMANMANQQEAYRLLSESGQSPDRQAGIRLGQTLTKYFDPGFAQQELNTNDETARYGMDLTSGDNRNEDNLRFGVGGQGDRDTTANNAAAITMNKDDNAAQESWENYKSDRTLDGKKYDVDSRDQTALDVKDKDVALQKWKHNNRDLEIAVEPGKQIVLNPAAGKLLGVTPNDAGLYVLDGGPKPGALVVKVGKEDVYLTEEDAKALGVTKNDAGQFVIPGKPELAPKNSQGSSSSSSGGTDVGQGSVLNMTRFQEQFKKDYAAYRDQNNPLPEAAVGGINTLASQLMQQASEAGQDVNSAYSSIVVPMLSAGTYEVTKGGRNFNVPKYFFNLYRNMPQAKFEKQFEISTDAADGTVSKFVGTMRTLGYDQSQIQRFLNEIIKSRQSQ